MRLELLTAPENGFIVGRDLVGFANVGNDPDVWADITPGSGEIRADRGGSTSRPNARPAGVLTTSLRDADPDTDLRLRVGRRVRLYDDARGDVLWYGRITGVPAIEDYDKDTGTDYRIVTLTAGDAVTEAANTTVPGTGPAYGKRENLRQRCARLGALSTVPVRHTYAPTELPTDPAGAWSARNDVGAPLAVTPVPGGGRVDQPSSWNAGGMTSGGWVNLSIPTPEWVPGGTFAIAADVKVQVILSGSVVSSEASYLLFGFTDAAGSTGERDWHVFTGATGVPTPAEFTAPPIVRESETRGFVVTAMPATPAAPSTGASATTRLEVTNVRAVSPEGLAVLAPTALSASLDAHLTMATNTARATWKPTLEGTIDVHEGPLPTTPVAAFSDVSTGVSVTEFAMGYDRFVNDLTVTNRLTDPEGKAADVAYRFENITSIAGHGRAADTLDLCLGRPELVPYVTGYVFADRGAPTWQPQSVTYLYDDLAAVPDLDDLVLTLRRGVTYPALVTGVSHRITPDPEEPTGKALRHLVTLHLRKAPA